MGRARRALFAVPAVLALAWAMALCTNAARASWIASSTQDRSELQRASALAPGDPELHELLGLAYVDEPQRAQSEITRALVLRPTSPYTWANLAAARYRAGVTDEIFRSALVLASELGPSEPEVQLAVALYGLAVWDELPTATRQAVERMVVAGARRDAAGMLRTAQRRGRLDVACPHVDVARLPPDLAKLCNSRETSQ